MLPSRDSGCKVTAFSFIYKELCLLFVVFSAFFIFPTSNKKKWAHDITSKAHTTQTQNCGYEPTNIL
mgnify:CR=1 FL=1